jgi:predicted dehydrogenase
MQPDSLPLLRWGIIGAGQISSWFVRDLSLSRQDAKATHIIQSIGSSSQQKGLEFVQKYIPHVSPPPKVFTSYEEVYADPQVDIIYIGTPNALHKQNCLDAINKGKHVLCEKAFAVTSREAREVFAAAKEKGVFVMEAMWTRFFPLVHTLQRLVHEEKAIGDVHRMFCDLGLDMDIASLGPESRLRNRALGAGTLLDICIYSLTWGLLMLDPKQGKEAEKPRMVAVQTLSKEDEIDVATSILLLYPSTGRQGILTSTSMAKTPSTFCRIEGTEGYITVEGVSASAPSAFTLYPKAREGTSTLESGPSTKRYQVEHEGFGMFWEADSVALDITAGKTENAIMPWRETLQVMEMMDEVRRQGGARFPQDDK